MYKNNFPVVGVGAVVFHNDAVLLVQRKVPPNQNQWCIPGGKVHSGESLKHATEREILEETTITIEAGEPIYSFELIDTDKNDNVKYHYVIIDLIAEYIAGNPEGKDDAKRAVWVNREIFSTLPVNETTKQLLRDKFNFP